MTTLATLLMSLAFEGIWLSRYGKLESYCIEHLGKISVQVVKGLWVFALSKCYEVSGHE
jgi:hypothetical protein